MIDPAEHMSEEQRLEAVLARAYRGLHHVPNEIKKHPRYWETNVYDSISTFDFDVLTRLVLAAHRYAVRLEIDSSGPSLLKLRLFARVRHGNRYDRHPTIEEAIADYMIGEPEEPAKACNNGSDGGQGSGISEQLETDSADCDQVP
jgi:hypothetical protein